MEPFVTFDLSVQRTGANIRVSPSLPHVGMIVVFPDSTSPNIPEVIYSKGELLDLLPPRPDPNDPTQVVRAIFPNDDISLKSAYYLAGVVPLRIVPVIMPTTATGGVAQATERMGRCNMADLLCDGSASTYTTWHNAFKNLIVSHGIMEQDATSDKKIQFVAINMGASHSPSAGPGTYPVSTHPNTIVFAGYFGYDGLGYPAMLPATVQYISLLANQFNNLDYFAPTFNKVLFPLSTPLDRIYTTGERNALNNNRINCFKPTENGWVFNDNITLDSATVFSEENIRRLAVHVRNDLITILKQFLGYQNTKKTRDEVILAIRSYWQRNIEIHRYRPTEVKIVCDESNNVDYDNRLYVSLDVKMPRSVKYIHLLTVAMNLNPA